jgi:ubiquinone/menaquinone biosynthesis C-methylase UbiE
LKRLPPNRDIVFSDPAFAGRYAKKHAEMQRRFGKEYAEKLRVKGFTKGRILDAGCGFGETLFCLAESFPEASLTGIDLSDPLLDIARSKVTKAGLSERIEFKKADVCSTSYPDKYFNVVLNINMVHVVENPVEMLGELERILAVDGHLFIVDIRRSWVGLLEREFFSALSVTEAEQLLNESTLRKGEMTSTTLWWRYEG